MLGALIFGGGFLSRVLPSERGTLVINWFPSRAWEREKQSLAGQRHFVVNSPKYKPDAQAREYVPLKFPRLRVGLVLHSKVALSS